MDTLLVASDADAKQVPNMELAQLVFSYEYFLKTNAVKSAGFKKDILEIVTSDSMGPYYKDLCTKYNWSFDQALYGEMM
jgi:hypothetical protein